MSHFDLASLSEQLVAYQTEMEAPDFWEDVTHANLVNQKMRPLENTLEAHAALTRMVEDLETLLLLAEEEQDDSLDGEIEETAKTLESEVRQFRLAVLLGGEYDANNAIVSLHAGAGGTEAQDWNAMLYRMYTRWAERHHYKVTVLDYLDGDEAGVKSVTMLIEGVNAYGYLRSEKGVHRLVRISPFDSSARRHTSFASVDVTPEIIGEDESIEIPADEMRIDTYRSSGAGGQHVNTTDSAVRITHIPTGIVVQCQNERSQIQNRETCMRMLRSKLAEIKEAEKLAELTELKGEQKKIEWGSQIRSYVFHPYSMVKDHRTSEETGNIDAVMDGDLDAFINAYLITS